MLAQWSASFSPRNVLGSNRNSKIIKVISSLSKTRALVKHWLHNSRLDEMVSR